MNTFSFYFTREIGLLLRNSANVAQPILFFVIIALIFPFSLPAASELLSQIGGGVIWVAAVLATILSLEAMFKPDYQDGSLEQILIHRRSLAIAATAKAIAHWCANGLLLCMLSPILAISFNIPSTQIWVLFASLLIGTPSLSLIGAIGAALTVTLQRGGVLIAVIILPLYVPILIFGAGVLNQSALGLPVASELYALLAILVLSLTLAPLAIASALRLTID